MKLLPNTILRSIIRFGDEPEEILSQNLMQLRAEVEPYAIDKHVLTFLSDLFDRTHSVPSAQLVTSHYRNLESVGDGNGPAALARISQCLTDQAGITAAIPFISGNDFRYQLDQFKGAILRESTSQMLLEASAILTSGHKDRKGIIHQGPEATLEHLNNRSRENL